MPQKYRVIGKAFVRTQATAQPLAVDVHTNTVQSPVPIRTVQQCPVGTVLDDVTAAELAAFPDRFELIAK
jgi:hypothetical protein